MFATRLSILAFCLAFLHANSQTAIWPGDANDDGIVNNLDVLNVGLGFGKQGVPRDSVSNMWQQENFQPWNDSLPSGQNLGYADCSGNGFINIEDVFPIESNYGDTNASFNGLTFLNGSANDPALTILTAGSNFEQGQAGSATIYLDEELTDSIYGIAFTFTYDTTLIKRATVVAAPHPQFAGGGRQPVYVQKNNTAFGELEFGISRTNGINHGGGLPVCIVSFVIEDNLIGKTWFDYSNVFTLKNIRLFDRAMHNIPVRGDTSGARIMSGIHEQPTLPFHIYPVPASNWLFIDNAKNEKLISIDLIDLKGMVYALRQAEHGGSVMIDVSPLPRGMYVLRVVTENGSLHQKVMIGR